MARGHGAVPGGTFAGGADRLARRQARGAARRDAAGNPLPDRPRLERLRALWPDLRELDRPRLGVLLGGLALMTVNRVAGLALPGSTKVLVDDVIGKGRRELLAPLLGAVVLATLVQGLSSYALTQSLSKAAQRLIAELRRDPGALGDRVLFLHTGGIFGLMPRGDELAAVL